MRSQAKTGGGVGTNQYGTRGSAKSVQAVPPLSDHHIPSYVEMTKALTEGKAADITKVIRDPQCPAEVMVAWADALCQSLPNNSRWSSRAAQISGRVAQALAAKPNIPPIALDHMLGAKRVQVRQGALACPYLTDAQWDRVRSRTFDSISEIRGVISNPLCDGDLLRRIDQFDTLIPTKTLIAQHPRCPHDLMIQYLQHKNPDIRRAVLANPSLPDHIKAIAVLGS